MVNKMSMNLKCSHAELWQTPTYITNMCLLHDDPVKVLQSYKLWVLSHLNGVWEDQDDYNNIKALVRDHCNTLNELINNLPKDLKMSCI